MIRLLTSAMGLGTYVPALLLADYIRKAGRECQIQVIEAFLGAEKIEKFLKNKEKYHQSFKVAKMGHKLAEKKLGSLLNSDEMSEIFREWDFQEAEAFVVMSGNWVDALQQYEQIRRIPSDSIYSVHMDVGVTPSWCRFTDAIFSRNFKVYDDKGVNYLFEYPEFCQKSCFNHPDSHVPWVYVHGGGWGMGTYQSRYRELKLKLPYHVRTTIHSKEEADFSNGWEYYLMDQKWSPWSAETDPVFPPIYRVYYDEIAEMPNEMHKGIYSLYKDSCAIISKAGGGTLMDSLITATPLVFIEPIAKHEQENQNLWIKLGLGIRFEDWEKEGFSINILRTLYENILSYRKNIPGLGHELLAALDQK